VTVASVSMQRPGVAWAVLASVLAAGAVAVDLSGAAATFDWQPGRWVDAPWRVWTAAFVHLSPSHLAANLAATALLAAIGWLVALPLRDALAWFAAWPLTHLGLLSMPALKHYGGLSGVLHGAVAVIGVHLVWRGAGRQRVVGALLLTGLAARVLSETPWRAAVQVSPHWDIPIAPIAHLTGAVAGFVCAVVAEALARGRDV